MGHVKLVKSDLEGLWSLTSRHDLPDLLFLSRLRSLLHLKSQQAGFRASESGRLVALFLIKGIAAFVQGINLCLAFVLVE